MKSKKPLAALAYLCEVSINPFSNVFAVKPFLLKKIRMVANRRRSLPLISLFSIITLLFSAGCDERQLAKPTPQMDVGPDFWIRVLLLDDVETCTIYAPSFTALDTKQIPRFIPLKGPAKVNLSNGIISVANRPFAADELVVVPDAPHIFTINGDAYRGKLKIILNSDGKSFDAVNLVPLEPYLAGVVAAEMPNYWETEALKAQAIAARTYCLYVKRTLGQNRKWDLTKTQAHQVYQGLKAETKRTWHAVNSTYGRTLSCKQSAANFDIFPTYYSSVCGGHTESSKNIFGNSFEPLVGVRCPNCRTVAKPGLFFWPMVEFKKDFVSDKLIKRYPNLKPLGRIEKITVDKQTDYDNFSRMTNLKLVGSNGKSEFIRAEDLRLTIDPSGQKIKSTACTIIDMGDKWAFTMGRGFGHGVGLCQYGAQALARKGVTARQILVYYYPNSKIKNIYKEND